MSSAPGGVPSEKQELLQAIDFALVYFDAWLKEGRVTPEQHQVLSQYYKDNRNRIEDRGAADGGDEAAKARRLLELPAAVDPRSDEFCLDCGAPLQSHAAHLRFLIFLCHEIKKHETAGRINLATSHDLLADGNNRITALRRKLDLERVPLVQAITTAPTPAVPASGETLSSSRRKKGASQNEKQSDVVDIAKPRRNIIEILLDPRTIQWMLASGGAALVLGLIIWLAAEGLFENKIFVAVLLGIGNAALLAGGWSLIRFTRYQIAGRAVTLLACLVMPLNLWFYDAQHLIRVNAEGNHLWLAALVICALYAMSAWLLKDAMFVPVFVVGVTMTGLLLLADHLFESFWEIKAPATLLVVLGLSFLHVERVFPVDDSPFSRRKFGLAFFWSGHAVLALGLGLLFFAQLFGDWLYPLVEPIYKEFGFKNPEFVTSLAGKWLILILVAAGTYAYIYSDLVVRRIGVYLPVAVFTLLWAEVVLISIIARYLNIPEVEIVIIALALTGLASNYLIVAQAKNKALMRVGAPLALLLCGVPVLLGLVLQIRGTVEMRDLHKDLAWSYVIAMAITAVSCRVGAYLYRHVSTGVSTTYFFGTAAATLAAAAGLLLVLSDHKMAWHDQAPLLMIIPIIYLIASRLYRGHTAEQPLGWVAHAATAVMLAVSVMVGAFELLQTGDPKPLHLMLSIFFAEATLFYGIAAATRDKAANVYFGTAAAFAATWQLFSYLGIQPEWYALVFAAVGLALLILYRFAVLERFRGGLAAAAFQSANTMLWLAFAAAALITGFELLRHFDEIMRMIYDPASGKPLLVPMLLSMVAVSLISVALVKHQVWRRFYVGASIFNAALAVLVLVTLGRLTPPQKMEIAALIVGLLLLGAGYFGWYREQERHTDLTSMALIFGSLLLAVPFTIAVVSGRLGLSETWYYVFNEIGMLAFGLLLLASGYACHLKAPTLAGTYMVAVWVVSLLLYIRLPQKLQTTAIYLMVGGGVFFLAGLLLSIYRDRLLTMPERIKRREGVFRVLSWR